jgi:Rrf2 family protein
LAYAHDQGPQQLDDIAQAENIPRSFLSGILVSLTKNGLLTSKKGKGGGYTLARRADLIRVGDIVRTLDGPLAPIPCVSRLFYRKCDDCRDERACAVRAVMGEVRDAIAAILDNCTLAELINRAQKGEQILQYDI